jgi:hypothetical protein
LLIAFLLSLSDVGVLGVNISQSFADYSFGQFFLGEFELVVFEELLVEEICRVFSQLGEGVVRV